MNFTSLLAQSSQVQSNPAQLSLGYLISLLIMSVVILLVLILKLRMQAFLALLLSSLFVAVGSCKELTGGAGTLELAHIGDHIHQSMGSSLGFIATIVGLGAIFGALLEDSGGAKSLAQSLIGLFGDRRAPWAMVLTGFIISIPVFLDVALVVLAPIIYALSRRTGKSVLTYGLPLLAGLAVTHAFVPPTPGPVWVAYELGVGLGWVILFGTVVGIPAAIVGGVFLPPRMAERLHVAAPERIDEPEGEAGCKLPSLMSVLILIGLPIALILLGTIVKEAMAWDLDGGLSRSQYANELSTRISRAGVGVKLITFVGHPIISLIITTLASLIFLGYRRGVDRNRLMQMTTRSLGPAGVIILITGAGGVFKGIMGESGVADALKEVCQGWGLNVIVLAFLFAFFVRVAQGSATVAMVTAAGLMASMTEELSQPQLALVVIAISAGATAVSHVNDSGFWMVGRYLMMTEKQTFETWTVISTVIALTGFFLTLCLWHILPLVGV
jgi:gluconate transporter